ncbi:hypothetical protein B296_00038598 [Ensete ventricosum]|uniref:MCAfunc domain-containing protein n=1 Tax=Ensete ventricosum TaxID=4639 RepID=A0A426Y8F6_ENSVE|nr:hypothetical protein B296_00038598 [Ensete ventricosum]
MASSTFAGVTGQIANVAQLAGVDVVGLIFFIVEAAAKAQIYKKSCREMSDYLQLISDLLEPLDMSDLRRYPETRAALERLGNALKECYILIHNCQNRSFLYIMTMGWMFEHRFQKVEAEIERHLKLIPLIIFSRGLGVETAAGTGGGGGGAGVEVDANPDLEVFQLSQLKHATRNFSHGKIVGKGEFTVVYKGRMDDKSVAVKTWKLNSNQGLQEWMVIH